MFCLTAVQVERAEKIEVGILLKAGKYFLKHDTSARATPSLVHSASHLNASRLSSPRTQITAFANDFDAVLGASRVLSLNKSSI